MEKETFRQIAERLGWNATIDDEGRYCNISQYSPEGQDVNFTVDVSDEDKIFKEVSDIYEGFDVDEETYIWIGPDGHGKKKAPYHIKDIVKDMEWVDKQLEKLYDEVFKEEFK